MTASRRAPQRNARYDPFASWYDAWVASPEDDLVATSLLRLIGPVVAQRIVDLGCGQGRIARELAALGNEVTGVDLSGDLLAIARGGSVDRITYVHADVTATDWWDGRPFDGAVASMALMDIDDLDGAVTTAAAVVRPRGWFVWSIIHPAFPGVGDTRPSWPLEGGYFDEGWLNTRGDGVRGRVGCNHRTLSTYLNAMTGAGFELDVTEEPPWIPGPGAPPAPFFLVTRWRRR